MSPAAAPVTNETMISQLLCLKAKKKKQEYFFINGSKQKRLKTVRLSKLNIVKNKEVTAQ